MKTQFKALASAMVLGMVVASGSAMAESTYGFNALGAGAVTATAHVNLSVTVPKLILLRVGSAGATIDTLSWTLAASIPATPTAATDGNDSGVVWDGNAPTLAPASATATTVASAWTNATTGTINCAVASPLAAGGPTLADFAVSVGAGTLPHPGATLATCASTAFGSGVAKTSTWTYTLGGSATTWAPGVYTAQIVYTASGI